MKQLFTIYTIIGLLCAPFIYFNNAEGYRLANSETYNWGRALGGAFYWPSYVFSIEPEVDGESLDSFQKSIINIINYRNNKLFTGKRSDAHNHMIFNAIGNCLVLEGAEKHHISSPYEEIFSEDTKDKEIERIKSSVMKKMDGNDFADIVADGAECEKDLNKFLDSATITTLAVKLVSELVSNIAPGSASEPKAESTAELAQAIDTKLMGDQIDDNPSATPNTEEDVADKASNKSWQDNNGYIHYSDGSKSSGPVD